MYLAWHRSLRSAANAQVTKKKKDSQVLEVEGLHLSSAAWTARESLK
jgi:alkylated DNA nucleotide flippase Atl1